MKLLDAHEIVTRYMLVTGHANMLDLVEVVAAMLRPSELNTMLSLVASLTEV